MKNQILKTVIIDDEQQAVNLLLQFAQDCPEMNVIATFTDPVKALLEVKILQPDLLLLDVQMPRMNGFELLRGIRNAGLNPAVIFVTAYDQFAIEAIHNEAFDYLMKPVSPRELHESVSRLISRMETQEDSPAIDRLIKRITTPKLQFPDRQGVLFISPEDLIFVEADGNYSKFRMKTREHLITRKIGELEEMLTPFGFIRVGRSYIINPLFLVRIDRKQRTCTLENGADTYEIAIAEDKMKHF